MQEEFGGGPVVKMVKVSGSFLYSAQYKGFALLLKTIVLPRPGKMSEEQPQIVKFSYEPDETISKL